MKSILLSGTMFCIMGPLSAFAASAQPRNDVIPADTAPESDTSVIVVTGTPPSRYVSRTPQSGSRIEKDILDTPRSIDAIPEQVLLDQHISELSEVYRYSANVVNNDGYGGTREDYIIRGFRRRDDVYRDGVRMKTNSIIDPSTVSAVEILKGPVSDIGQMTPGGLVNIVTKKPSVTAYRRADISVDNRGDRRGTIDLTDGFGKGRFAYRLTSSYQNGDTFRDDSRIKRFFVSGGLSWFGDNGALANVTYEHGDDERSMDRGVITLPVATGGTARYIPVVDRASRLEPAFSRRKSNYNLATADVIVPLGSPAWKLEGKFLFNNEKTDEVHTEVRSVAANGTLTRRVEGNDDRDLTTYFGRVQMRGEFALGVPIKTVVGVEYRKQTESWTNFVGANQVFGTVFAPQSNQMVNNGSTASSRTARAVSQQDYGPYFQFDAHLTEQLILTLGGRYETFKGNFSNRALIGTGNVTAEYTSQNKFTKSGALAWKPMKDWTIYADYSDTFQPQNYYEGSTQVFPPQNGRMFEVGVKKAAFSNALLLTAAYFDIKQDNLVEVANGQPILSGGQTSRGVELAAIGSPAPGLNLRAGFGYADAKAVSVDPTIDGQLPTNVPRYNANAWVSYEIKAPDSPLQGLGIGVGGVYVSNRYGDLQHSFALGDYTIFDASTWYYIPLGEGRQVRVTGGVKNIGNERYYTASGGTFRISVGAPRTFYAGLGFQF